MTERLSRAAAAAALLLWSAPALAVSTLVSGSVYVDYWSVPDAQARSRTPQGVTPEASIKVQADIHDDLSFSTKACMSCHGLELEHVMLDFNPRPWFNVQVGRIAVPFGEYANRVDPSGHKTVSAPLIYDMGRMAYGGPTGLNLGVLPQPYVDTGALVYGQRFLGESVQVWYGVYGVAGLKGANDVQWARMRGGSYSDNNNVPGGGGRVALTWSAKPGDFVGDASVGGSFTAGKYDDGAKLGYAVWGADAMFRLGPATFRGEWVQRRTDVDPSGSGFLLLDRYFDKSGWYAEVEHPVGRYVSFVLRADQLRRSGAPLPGADDPLSTFSRMTRYTAGVMISPVASTFVKAGWEYLDGTNVPDFHSFHLGFGGAF